MPISQGVLLQTTETVIFTATSETVITAAFFCNNHTTDAVDIDVYLVQNGSVASPQNRIYTRITIVAGDTFQTTFEKPNLGPGDSIVAVASIPNTVSAIVSYVEKPQ